MECLLRALSIPNIVKVMMCMMMEKSIVLISSKINVLYHCSVAMCSLLFPLKWKLKLIPFIPLSNASKLSEILECPQGYLFGIKDDKGIKFIDSTVRVHLLTNSIVYNESEKVFNTPFVKPLINYLTSMLSCFKEKPDSNLLHFDEAFMMNFYKVDEEQYAYQQVEHLRSKGCIL